MKEQYWNILSKTTDWIKFSDGKAVMILTVYGIIITLIYSNATDVYEFLAKSWVYILLSSISIILSIISIGYSFLTVNPKLNNKNPNSLIYFGHIQEKYISHIDYYNDLSALLNQEDGFEMQLAEQIHTNSKIAWKKFRCVTISIRYFVASITLVLLELILYFLIK